MNSKIEDYVKLVKEDCPTAVRLYMKAFDESNKSFREHVDAKCIECVNFENYPAKIKECSIVTCPLHPIKGY
jgi:hypothetical protein